MPVTQPTQKGITRAGGQGLVMTQTAAQRQTRQTDVSRVPVKFFFLSFLLLYLY